MPAGLIGILLGLFAAAMVIATVRPGAHSPAREGVVLSECDGRIDALAMQWARGAEFVLATYRDFLRQLPADVTVYLACPAQEDFDAAIRSIGPVPASIRPVICGHAITCWSRDRWVSLGPVGPNGARTLLCPATEEGAEVWPERSGDERIAFDLASTLGLTFRARRSGLVFDGGDFLADASRVFITPAVLRRNLQKTAPDREQLLAELRRMLGREAVLLDTAPIHHAGMYMASAGNGIMLVGDPSLGVEFLSTLDPRLIQKLPGGPDLSPATQSQFDAVARRAESLGYHVLRIPIVLSPDGKTYLTYVNGIIDQRAGQRTVYMPSYRGADQLNGAAAAIWRSAGCEVRPVDCTEVFERFGTLHCLVNVLART